MSSMLKVSSKQADGPVDARSDGAPRFVWGQSPAMRALEVVATNIARSPCNVLLTGETGTGKGVLAREIHALSGRAARPFVHVDCASLTPSLIESELFGHERGAFTGAVQSRRGRFELAAGGSIFLDEIGELPQALQAKLLRVLQDRVYERIGGGHTQAMTARVVAATNRDLRDAVSKGRFRADLFFRLAVVELDLPPLRERSADLPQLVAEACRLVAARHDDHPVGLTPDAVGALAEHDWPGNVRELVNVVERLAVCGRERRVDRRAVMAALGAGVSRARLDRSGDSSALLERAVAACDGNVAHAARQLGVARSTLRYRLARARRQAEPAGRQLSLPGIDMAGPPGTRLDCR
jgi:transcriptional regulator with GAF, ATPase, and Fis domain